MNKIGVLLEAGLCNQLFMIFALLSYCIDNLKDYCIYYKRGQIRTYWDTLLDSFAAKATIDTPANDVIIYNEPHFHYKKIPVFNVSTNLKGYFQSYKYFEHNLSEILERMHFNDKMASVKQEYEQLLTKKCIALHFRIGDYIGLQPYHPIQQPYYYIRAIKHMMNELPDFNDYNILYFCQASDNPIVEQYLQILRNTFGNLNFVKVPDTIDDWKQLLIMTSCEHFIIANSTFSWFPAYIRGKMNAKKTIVCYPTHWFGVLYANNRIDDLIVDGWSGFDDRT